MKRSFTLIAVDVPKQSNPHIQKILKEGLFIFDKRYKIRDKQISFQDKEPIDVVLDTMYGDNIQIHAIVGKNGSGKSTLLDIICRIVNNLSYSLLAQSKGVSVYNIGDLTASLYYAIDNQCYCISCNNYHFKWTKQEINTYDKEEIIYDSSNRKPIDDAFLLKECKEVFYTIVTNYSPHSLIPNEYREESIARLYKDVLTERDETSWLPNLFHKNDGYMTPITLVPYRENNGSIDVSKELHLSKYRLSSIFLFYRYKDSGNLNDNGVIDSYALNDIRYTYTPSIATEKCRRFSTSNQLFTSRSKNAIGRLILAEMEYDEPFPSGRKDNNLYEFTCLYLASKILAIVTTYPSYSEFKPLFFDESYGELYVKNGLNSPAPSTPFRQRIKDLVKQIIDDETHITIKVRQTMAMLDYIQRCDEKSEDYTWLTEEFGYAEYIKRVHGITRVDSIREMQLLLPPPIFATELLLDKRRDPNTQNEIIENEKGIELSSLSSGERQLLFVLSTYVYHTLNLMSNSNDPQRISYQNITLLMDEVEICFHPDYQRNFIKRLVNVLTELGLNKECSFYIMLATHSPFILSDIPQQNILYLEDGMDVGCRIDVNPFCANVNDILYQSFFLDNGFSGAFATSKVKSLMAYLQPQSADTDEWDMAKAEAFIKKLIGDPILRDALRAMFYIKQKANEKDLDK